MEEDLRGFRIFLRGMTIGAICSPDTQREWLKKVFIIYKIAITAIAMYIFFLQAVDLYDSIPNVSRIVYNLCFTSLTALWFCKYIVFYFKIGALHEFAKSRDDFFKTCNKTEQGAQLLYKTSKIFPPIFFGLVCVVVVAITGYFLIPLRVFGETKVGKFPMITVELDVFEITWIYVISYLAIIFTALPAVIGLLCGDMMGITSMIQLLLQYRILTDKINNSSFLHPHRRDEDVTKEVILENSSKTEGDLEISELVQIHQLILQQITLFDSFHSPVAVVEVFVVNLILCCLGYELFVVSADFNMLTAVEMLYGALGLADLIAHCIVSTKLLEANDKLMYALYDIDWQELNSSQQKTLVIMMTRCQQPPTLTVVEEQVANHIITRVLKDTFNLLAFIRQIKTEDTHGD